MGAIYLDSDLGLTTANVPHRVRTYNKDLYFFAQLPAGDYAFHMQYFSERARDGYGGGVIDFLMEDGDIWKVKGPYSTGCPWAGITDVLKDLPGTDATVSRLVIYDTEPSFLSKDRGANVVRQEDSWKLGDWRQRLTMADAGLFYEVIKRHSSMMPSLSETMDIWKVLRPTIAWDGYLKWLEPHVSAPRDVAVAMRSMLGIVDEMKVKT